MKHIKTIIGLLILAALFTTGCAVFHQPVPETKISGTVAGQKFSLVNPKNTVVSNFDFTVSTNGTASLKFASLSSANDSNVVSGAYAGASTLVTATGEQLSKAFEAGGKAVGAATHTAVTGAP